MSNALKTEIILCNLILHVMLLLLIKGKVSHLLQDKRNQKARRAEDGGWDEERCCQ